MWTLGNDQAPVKFFWASSLGDTLDQLLAEFVDNFLAMPHIGLLALWSILVPEVTAPHVFEPKPLPCPFNEFHESLRVAIHKRYCMRLRPSFNNERPQPRPPEREQQDGRIASVAQADTDRDDSASSTSWAILPTGLALKPRFCLCRLLDELGFIIKQGLHGLRPPERPRNG
jgi:hypothetical protein